MIRAEATPAFRVLALNGSLRRHSYNGMLLRQAALGAPRRLTISIYERMADIPGFNEDLEDPPPTVIGELRQQLAESDGLLIATPEYNQSFPGLLKNVIDWLSRPDPGYLVRKPVALMGVTAGRWGTRLAQAALRQTLAATEAIVMPAPSIFIRDAAHVFQSDGSIVDARVGENLRAMLDAFTGWLDVLCTERREK
jgi:chromate reductase